MSVTRSGSASARDEVLEAACTWFDRMQDDGQTLDRAALDRWLRERPEHRVAFETVRSAHARARTAVEDPAILALRHETALRLTRRARRSRWASLAAALAAIAVGAAIWVQLDLSDGGSRLPLIAQALRSLDASERGDYATRIGERLVVTLADGSRVTLNTNTKLQEVFDQTERRVVLDHGQALFEVAHDTVRPFVVEAHGRRLVALGTAFDVRVDGTRVQVTMLEGIVAVERTSGVPDVGVDGSGQEEAVPLRIATLTAGEQLTTEAAQADRVRSADPLQVTSWRRGQVIFEDVPLAEAVDEINRYSLRRIELADASLAQLRLSGAFATGSPEVFVEALTTYFPIDVRRREAARIVLGSRE